MHHPFPSSSSHPMVELVFDRCLIVTPTIIIMIISIIIINIDVIIILSPRGWTRSQQVPHHRVQQSWSGSPTSGSKMLFLKNIVPFCSFQKHRIKFSLKVTIPRTCWQAFLQKICTCCDFRKHRIKLSFIIRLVSTFLANFFFCNQNIFVCGSQKQNYTFLNLLAVVFAENL